MNSHPAPFISRRRFLQTMSVLSAVAVTGLPRRALAAPGANVVDTKVISQEPQYYHGWPTIARRRDGTLIVVCSGGRQKHVCPFGRVELMVSHDEGGKWSWPRTILDTDLDDRDAGVLETQKGTLIVTTFTSLYYEQFIKAVENGKSTPFVNAETLSSWQAARDRLSTEERQAELGQWLQPLEMADVLEKGRVIRIILALVVRAGIRHREVDHFQGIEDRNRTTGDFGQRFRCIVDPLDFAFRPFHRVRDRFHVRCLRCRGEDLFGIRLQSTLQSRIRGLGHHRVQLGLGSDF